VIDGISSSVALDAVAQAVAASESNEPIPSVLTPTLATAQTDGVSLGDCSAFLHLRSKICNYGDPTGTKTMVVFGNSHSAMWVPALSIIAKSEGWKFYPVVKEACAYETYPDVGHEWNELNWCTRWYDWAKTVIAGLHPNVLIIGSYDSTPHWIAGETTVINQLKPLTKRLILLSDDTHTTSPGACLVAPGATLLSCLSPQAEPSLQISAQNIATATKVNYLDISPLACDGGFCPAVIDGIIPTKDGAHMTPEFSAFVAPTLGPALNLGGTNTIAIVPVPVPPAPSSTTGTTTTTATVVSGS
jgi:hypothetical protein